jgi:hypothetical protein
MAQSSAVDMFVVYQFIRRLSTPFNKWEGFKSGVIDAKGNIKVKPKDRTPAQNRSFKVFDVMVLKLKRLLEKVPFGRSRLASYAAALYLIKEDWDTRTEDQILNESSDTFTDYIRIYRLDNYKRALEEMPTNAAGSGAVAGMGVNGPDDVKVSKKKKFKYKNANKIDAENYHSGIKDYVNRRFNGIM